MKVEYSTDRNIAFCDGYKFRRDAKTGYYLCTKKTDAGRRERLHVYVWRKEKGEIPFGYHVHHVDGDKGNNSIENLACITEVDHLSHHGKERDRLHHDAIVKNLRENVEPKGAQWHKSEQGREWHKGQYERMKDNLHVWREYVCENCGKTYKSPQTNSRFCSNACKAAARRKSGVDNEVRECQWCGKLFTVNKYSNARTCGRECRGKLRWYQERQEMR